MANNNHSDEDIFFEDIIKKTKTGITFPKELRDIMFSEDAEIYFKLKVPKDKSKIILEVISEASLKPFRLIQNVSFILTENATQRIRIDRESEANHDLIR